MNRGQAVRITRPRRAGPAPAFFILEKQDSTQEANVTYGDSLARGLVRRYMREMAETYRSVVSVQYRIYEDNPRRYLDCLLKELETSPAQAAGPPANPLRRNGGRT
jgi:hypothetical protein